MPPAKPDLHRRRFMASMAICAATASIPGFGAQTFRGFDSLGHRGKPNLRHVGMEPIASIYNVWSKGASQDAVDEWGVKAAVDRIASDVRYAYIDIEVWPLLG